ncbi:class C sortase [Microbacterium sp. LWO12-1.2]|uniref:class C sortase n=1 Tax=Microbacterium sp. LWO12-1.2 TaxID=3135261 RepID=UPI003440320B
MITSDSQEGALPPPPATHARREQRRPSRRWRPSALLILTVIAAVAGATVLTYSPAASWLSSYNQSLLVGDYGDDVDAAAPGPAAQLAEAHRYNDALSSGALLAAHANVPEGDGVIEGGFDYDNVLRTPSGVMSRIQIPGIGVDLPVYHGTSEQTLLRGAGHLEGTSLPIGGESTHAVITAHRGLADATMFTDLNRVEVGDLFTVNTFGEVLTYRVVDTRVVDPADTTSIRQEAGRDLVTLVTCTPLGINSHRILVTGERATPTPPGALEAATGPSEAPGFPWWLLGYGAALAAIAGYAGWAGRTREAVPDARRRPIRHDRVS